MSETVARRTTRQKKPSRQYWYDEQDYSNIVTSKTQEQKDRNKGQDQGIVLAKLLAKFVNSTNTKSRNCLESNGNQLPNQNFTPTNPTERTAPSQARKDNARVKNQPQGDQRTGRNMQQTDTGNDSRGVKTDTKPRGSKNGKSTQVLSTSLETDLSYHTALNQHVKQAYPNINSLSPDMLRQLSIPTEILSKPAVVRPKSREDKKGNKGANGQNKPFKRQSYHVAIAYHIHLKQVKGSKTVEYVDPTFPAKKLREEEAKRT